MKKITPMPTFTYKPIVHRGEKRILIFFTYDAKIVAELRKKTNAIWSKTHSAWHIEDTVIHRIKCKLPLENKADTQKKITTSPNQVTQKNIIILDKKIITQPIKEALPTLSPTWPPRDIDIL